MEYIPLSIMTLITKGEQGLFVYSQLLKNIEDILHKNQQIAEQMIKYHKNFDAYEGKFKGFQNDFKSIYPQLKENSGKAE